MFTSRLVLEADDAPGRWLVRRPLIWEDPKRGRIIVPDGFSTDLASIPKAVRCLPGLDPNGCSRRPGVLHDWLYSESFYARKLADQLLLSALRADGTPLIPAVLIYLSVRAFGWIFWDPS